MITCAAIISAFSIKLSQFLGRVSLVYVAVAYRAILQIHARFYRVPS